MTRLAECGVCNTLEQLYLRNAVDLSSNYSVEKLAEILSEAPKLTTCNIDLQLGGRVGVEVIYATIFQKGKIVFTDHGQEFYIKETSKRETENKMQISY